MVGAMRVVMGSDHAGYVLKVAVSQHLMELGHEVEDIGTFSEEPVD
jgi:ribose 5-phosphate isomerase B